MLDLPATGQSPKKIEMSKSNPVVSTSNTLLRAAASCFSIVELTNMCAVVDGGCCRRTAGSRSIGSTSH